MTQATEQPAFEGEDGLLDPALVARLRRRAGKTAVP
ncbi:hypothetical protein ACVWXM_009667 [Bradyrhizobium sp. GM7.3]